MGRSRKGRRGRRAPARRTFGGAQDRRQPRGRWSAEIRAAFLAMLSETGNARACYRALGHENMFRKRKRSDPEFAADWEAAVAEADARWRAAENAFPEAAVPGDSEAGAVPRPGPLHHASHGPPSFALRCSDVPRTSCAPRPRSGEDLGGYLKPGRKRAPSRPQAVVRRTSNGRWQVSFARAGHWTEEIEADFLARLRATGNFSACALAVGFQPASVFERARKWAGFARACEAALGEASLRLDHRLVAEAHNLLGAGEAEEGSEEGTGNEEGTVTSNCPRFDAEAAMRILGFLDRRRSGRTTRGRRKGPPGLALEEAVESVLAKIEAIERHEKWLRECGREMPDQAGGEMPDQASAPTSGKGAVPATR